MQSIHISRRTLITTTGAVLFTSQFVRFPGLFADELRRPTPRLTEGPFYPDRLPLDQDNDLILISDSITPAVGTITHLTGRVLTTSGSPVRGATVEIWQCDANQVYLHSRDSTSKKAQQDANFQGYGKFETAQDGGYRFRTIKPVPYPGRPAPHIHFKISQNGREVLTTQLLIRGYEDNQKDGVFRHVDNLSDRELLLGDFIKLPESKIGEMACNFDIVLGRTPSDPQ